MTRKTLISAVLLLLTFPAQEIWQLWKDDNRDVNWWIALDYPLNIAWYFKFLGNQIASTLTAIVIYRITFKIAALRKTATVYLIYSLVDFLLFFCCFNRASSALILSTVAVVSLLVFNIGTVKRMFEKPQNV